MAVRHVLSHRNLRTLLLVAFAGCLIVLVVEVLQNLKYHSAHSAPSSSAHPFTRQSASHAASRLASQGFHSAVDNHQQQQQQQQGPEEVLMKLRLEIEKQNTRTEKRRLFKDEVRALMEEIGRLKSNSSGPIKAEDLKTFADVTSSSSQAGSVTSVSYPVSDQCSVTLKHCKADLAAAGSAASSSEAAGNGDGAAAADSGVTTAVNPPPVNETETLAALQTQYEQQQILYERLTVERERLAAAVAHYSRNTTLCNDTVSSSEALQAARKAIEECSRAAERAREAAGLGSSTSGAAAVEGIRATRCEATDDELLKFLDYSPKAACPDDWYLVQHLIFNRNCYCLPVRRCLAQAPPDYQEPSIPFPDSVFNPDSLLDANVRWDLHRCKSYRCINSRLLGDCRDCFNLTLEAKRWRNNYRGAVRLDDVMRLKTNGAIRIGLDAGGGTGSFAAALTRYNATVLTTAMNTETVEEVEMGLPYMETIAQRGLVPLHVPHKARQPFFDNTLDLIHTVNSIKYFTIPEFEELLFEWDRILRPGGIWWFELFYAPVWEMPLYIGVIEQFGYGQLYWNLTPKTDTAEREGEHVYLNCVLEKPRRREGEEGGEEGRGG